MFTCLFSTYLYYINIFYLFICIERESERVIDGSLTVSVFQIQCGKMDSPGKVVEIKHQEHPHWRQYLELRKTFGLFKEERVHLTRIPLRALCESLEERVCSSDCLERKDDSCSSSSLDVEIISHHQESVKDEKVFGIFPC